MKLRVRASFGYSGTSMMIPDSGLLFSCDVTIVSCACQVVSSYGFAVLTYNEVFNQGPSLLHE